MVFKEVFLTLVVFELVKYIHQLDILRQLLVLGGREREVLPNNPVPVLLIPEFPLGQNIVGQLDHKVRELNGWLDLITATRVAGKQSRFLGLARCMGLAVAQVLVALVLSLPVTVPGIGVTLTVARKN